jgi:putative transposase
MPRRARLAIANIPWHIIQRGNNRAACFFTDTDRLYYLDQLQQQSEEFGVRIHAYCLMTNHVHLLLTPESKDAPSLMMKHLGQRYVQYINRRHQRSGTLWEGRFKSCLAQDEKYALTCYQYIELNPVRAGMVRHPGEYRWSSYGVNGEGKFSNLIKPHYSYVALGTDQHSQRERYKRLLESSIEHAMLQKIRNSTNGNFALGDSRFMADLESELGRRVSPGKSGRPRLCD